MKLSLKVKAGISVTSIILLSGCSTMGTYFSHKDLSVNSKMSESIFLDPVPDQQKVVYVQVKNTTTENLDGLKAKISEDLKKNGWKVSNSVDKSYSMIQVNVLQAGEAKDPQSAYAAISSGWGNVVTGGLAGVATGALTGNYAAGAAVGVGAGAADWLGSQFVKDKTFSVITDVQISQKVKGTVKEQTHAALAQGSATQTTQSYQTDSHWMRYRTRVGTVADQVNLTFKDAKPVIEKQLAQEITGVLG
ncbi:complement resistance protein TraT [Cysteiniphilum litorale]|uniref:complement resistance protein TraT n=1 Tax=Cysteiniphilum litorale TaxID=2056700 RepID=UPI003F884C69